MKRPSTPPDWIEALRNPTPGGPEPQARKGSPPCSRCRRPAASLESWLERRRLRIPDPKAAGGFRYAHRIREHLLCGPCYLEVRRGRPILRHNPLKIMALAVVGALALAAALPLAMPDLLAAFWQNGAAPDGWRHARTEVHVPPVQGRD